MSAPPGAPAQSPGTPHRPHSLLAKGAACCSCQGPAAVQEAAAAGSSAAAAATPPPVPLLDARPLPPLPATSTAPGSLRGRSGVSCSGRGPTRRPPATTLRTRPPRAVGAAGPASAASGRCRGRLWGAGGERRGLGRRAWRSPPAAGACWCAGSNQGCGGQCARKAAMLGMSGGGWRAGAAGGEPRPCAARSATPAAPPQPSLLCRTTAVDCSLQGQQLTRRRQHAPPRRPPRRLRCCPASLVRRRRRRRPPCPARAAPAPLHQLLQ